MLILIGGEEGAGQGRAGSVMEQTFEGLGREHGTF